MIVSEVSTSDYKPYLDIVFYKNESDRVYIEYAEVDNNKAYSYKPLSHEDFNRINKGFQFSADVKKSAFNSVIPKNVVYYDNHNLSPQIVWVSKSKYSNFFYGNKKYTITYPHMLFSLHNNSFEVYCVKTLNIDEDTPLYAPPFPNIYGGNNMCWGTMNIKDCMHSNFEVMMRNLENVFYNSKFTGEMMGGTSRANVSNYIRDYKNKNVPFNKKMLLKLRKTVSDVIHT